MKQEQIQKLHTEAQHDLLAGAKAKNIDLQDIIALCQAAEHSLSAQDEVLTDARIIQRLESHINTGPDCFDLQDGDCAYWVKQSEMVKFARALLAATPSPSLEVRDVMVDDLAMLVRRLVRSLEKANPGTDLAPQALDYLKRKGLQGSPLREQP